MSASPLTRHGTRLLGLAIVLLQLGGAAAIAEAHLRPSPADLSGTVQASTSGGVQVASAATEVAARVEDASLLTTTTTAPPPIAVPPPLPAPAPAPLPAPPPPSPPSDPAARVHAAYERSVPGAWREAIAVRLELIDGGTSWANPDGTIQVGMAHARGSDALLTATLAHEFGHLVAFRYGSQAFNGAAPDGWPPYGNRPAEAWADCVSRAFTNVDDPSHELPSCGGESLSWTSRWLRAGPSAHPRTG